MNHKKQQEHTSERQERFDVLAMSHILVYILIGISRTSERGIEHVPQIIRHQGLDFLAPVFAMTIGRLTGKFVGQKPELFSTLFGLGAIALITANEISQGLGHPIITQKRVADFEYKDLIAAALGFAYYKGLETIARKYGYAQ